MRYSVPIAALVMLLALAMPSLAKTAEIEPLSIETASGVHDFTVEVMRTGPQLERGLMFRRSMPEYHGMLFVFRSERSVSMWMKNTFIPLDMIFMAKTGRVVGIISDAMPMSEQLLSVNTPVFAVLEVNAGVAAKIDLKVDDMIRFGRAARQGRLRGGLSPARLHSRFCQAIRAASESALSKTMPPNLSSQALRIA